MSSFVTSALNMLMQQPSWLVFIVAAGWLMAESIGLGLPIEPLLLLLGALTVRASVTDSILPLLFSLIAAMVGTVLGALAGYFVGVRLGPGLPRVGRYVGLNQVRIDHLELWLRKRGMVGVIGARFIPVLRSYSPYVLGASQLSFGVFIIGTLLGASAYELLWIVLGYIFGKNYEVPLKYLDQFGWAGLAVVAIIILIYAVLRFVLESAWWRRLAAHFHLHGGISAAK